jgi:hypothetical protein
MGIGFVWFVSTHESDICWNSFLRDGFILDGKTCIYALDATFVSLKQPVIFIIIALLPGRSGFWIQKQLSQIECFSRDSVRDLVRHVHVIFRLDVLVV